MPIGVLVLTPLLAAVPRGLIFASVVLATAPAVLANVLLARQFISGMTSGEVKG